MLTNPSTDVNLSVPDDVRPDVEHLVTEDDTPVDNIFSERQQKMLTEPLTTSWREFGQTRDFVALANVGLFYGVKLPPFVPDALLSMDVKLPAEVMTKRHRSYFVWEYGKVPDVVVEVVSNTEGGEDGRKMSGYAGICIRYYVIYDPEYLLSDVVLRVYRFDGRGYQQLGEPYWLDDVGLGLQLWKGNYGDLEATWLRWHDLKVNLIPTGEEQRQRAELQQLRADEQKRRADEQQQRADKQQRRADEQQRLAQQQQQRAELLAELVRQLGGDPNGGQLER
jgi:Uma2 family endonuclease